MLFYLLYFFAGALTILSPCILPILPFVFARNDRPFWQSQFPILLGLIISFVLVSSLAAIGGAWVQSANEIARNIALFAFAVFGLLLLLPQLSEYVMRPFVRLGSNLSNISGAGFGGSFLIGIATGFLWAPCAGPILGIVLVSATTNGANFGLFIALFLYAMGAAFSISIALFAGNKVFGALKKGLGIGENIKKALGLLVLIGVGLIATGFDRKILTQYSAANTSKIEQALLDKFSKNSKVKQMADFEGKMPIIQTTGAWLNSKPISNEELKGKVVLIDFWTYSCINCLRTLPYLKAWNEKYAKDGLVIIGVHSPEFAFERNYENVKKAVQDLGIKYPVVLDNDLSIWQSFNNQYWPAHYFIDKDGNIRAHHFGEGNYDESEKIIQMLLKETGKNLQIGETKINANDIGKQAKDDEIASPETYIGYERSENFNSPQNIKQDEAQNYTRGKSILNSHSIAGNWTIEGQSATLNSNQGSIYYRFKARDLHLVLGPSEKGKAIRFKVLIDGKPPKENHGLDIDENGNGIITDERLYQLIRIKGDIGEHDFEIQFLDKGAKAYAFTFG